MVKVLNPKRHNMIVEITEEVPLIVAQKRFLEELIEGNMPEVRELASKTDEERYRIARDFFKVKHTEDENSYYRSREFSTYLSETGLIVPWTLRNKPKESRKRVIYLCLRGLREGFLQLMEMSRLIDSSEITSGNILEFYYPVRNYDLTKKKVKKKGGRNGDREEVIINTIKKSIARRLNESAEIKKSLSVIDCENIALSISKNYYFEIK